MTTPQQWVLIVWNGPYDCDGIDVVYGPFNSEKDAEIAHSILETRNAGGVTAEAFPMTSHNMEKFI